MGEVVQHDSGKVSPMRQGAVGQYGGRSLTAADIRAQVNLIQDVMGSVMKDGTHYGQIPGTQSKSLYKPGAEKIMATFRLVADPIVEDLGQDGEVHYRVKVWLYAQDGTKLGAGLGECSSQEEKYAWRKASSPVEWQQTAENRRRLKYGQGRNGPYEIEQVRTNPADIRNTVLKMAKKRGLVDAVLTVTAASDCFTQDIEDLPPEIAEEIARGAERNPESSPRGTEPAPYPQAAFDQNLPVWLQMIEDGKKTPDQIIARAETKGPMTKDQKRQIRGESITQGDQE